MIWNSYFQHFRGTLLGNELPYLKCNNKNEMINIALGICAIDWEGSIKYDVTIWSLYRKFALNVMMYR